MMSKSGRQVVVFKLGNEEYGFDIAVVREIHNMEDIAKVHRSAPHIEGVINLRGKLLTVVNLRTRFGMEPLKKIEGTAKIVVVEGSDALVGFLVDEVSEVARIDAQSIEKAPDYIARDIESQYVIGIAKHDGRLITLIDPLKVLELDSAGQGGSKNA